MPTDCDNCSGAKARYIRPPSSFFPAAFAHVTAYISPVPSLEDVKQYIKAVVDAGRLRPDSFTRDEHLAYTFLCQLRPGTTLYHGSTTDFTAAGHTIFRGAFYTTWPEYANLLLWQTLENDHTLNPLQAVVLQYAAPGGWFMFVNCRLVMNNLLQNVIGHNVQEDVNLYVNEFSQNRNYGRHAQIFCRSAARYGVANLEGVIQAVTCTNMEVSTAFVPVVRQGVNAAQKLQLFQNFCGTLNQGEAFAGALPTAYNDGAVNVNDSRSLMEFEEIYWNARPNPAANNPLIGAAPNPPGVFNAQVLGQLYSQSLQALLDRGSHGYQYCFDFKTYGPLHVEIDELGAPRRSQARACLTAFARTRAELNGIADAILNRLGSLCSGGGVKTRQAAEFTRLVNLSSQQNLTQQEIDQIRFAGTWLLNNAF